jgi:hypothetical protein
MDAAPAAAAKRAKTAVPVRRLSFVRSYADDTLTPPAALDAQAPPEAKPKSKTRGGAGSGRSSGGAKMRSSSKAMAPAVLTFQQISGKRDPTPPAEDPFAFFAA